MEAGEHHPDVLAARSKLRTAEAEQRQAELKAFKDLSEQVEVSLEETPLSEGAEFLSEVSGLRFILDHRNLEDGAADSAITLKLGKLELGAVLQALEDVQSPICFIVRDYGILVTTHDSQPMNSVTARDFWKLTEDELREKLPHLPYLHLIVLGVAGMPEGYAGQGLSFLMSDLCG